MDLLKHKRIVFTKQKNILIFLMFIASHIHATDNQPQASAAPPKIGNFILPASQQPGPLIGLGQNIISKNTTQLFLLADDYAASKQHFADLVPSVLYGITDRLSIFFNLPIAASYRQGRYHSAGLEDIFIQAEYAFYSIQNSHYTEQATIVTNLTLPTGSRKKQPTTGLGSPSFLLGATYNRTYTHWFFFASPSAILTTSHQNTKFGDQFYSQLGIGRNICNIASKWILAGVVEANELYSTKNVINGRVDPNSGGNTIFVTPSLWLSSKKLIVQAGIGLPITQHLYGQQKGDAYQLVLNVGWTFY